MLSHDHENQPAGSATRISEVMTPDPKFVTADQPVQDAAFIMREQDCGLVPVVDDDERLVGVVTDRDLVLRVMCAGLRPDETRVDEAMTHRVHKAKMDDSISDVHRIMSTHQIRRVPVVDETGQLTGIVALADVARHCETPQTLGTTVEQISLEPGEH